MNVETKVETALSSRLAGGEQSRQHKILPIAKDDSNGFGVSISVSPSELALLRLVPSLGAANRPLSDACGNH